MLTQDAIARLKDQVPDLAGRIEGAADLAVVLRKGGIPQVTPAAHVLASGLTGGKAETILGAFAQVVGRLVSVVLYFRSRDKTSRRGLDGVEEIIEAAVTALIGWTPDPATLGVFSLRGGRLVSVDADALVYQYDFVLSDEMRITS